MDAALTSYAAVQQLDLKEFERGEASFVFDDKTVYPAVSYRLLVQGAAQSLVGMLILLRDVPTALVQTLDFTILPESQDRWEVAMEMLVVYNEGSD